MLILNFYLLRVEYSTEIILSFQAYRSWLGRNNVSYSPIIFLYVRVESRHELKNAKNYPFTGSLILAVVTIQNEMAVSVIRRPREF